MRGGLFSIHFEQSERDSYCDAERGAGSTERIEGYSSKQLRLGIPRLEGLGAPAPHPGRRLFGSIMTTHYRWQKLALRRWLGDSALLCCVKVRVSTRGFLDAEGLFPGKPQNTVAILFDLSRVRLCSQ